MLVLTRKAKQRIQIGDNISITVLRVKGQTVRIGIDAPSEIRVRRSELATFDTEDQPVVSMVIAGNGSSDSSCPTTGKSPTTGRSVSERDDDLSHPFRSNRRVRNRTKNTRRESQAALLRRAEELVHDRLSSKVMDTEVIGSHKSKPS